MNVRKMYEEREGEGMNLVWRDLYYNTLCSSPFIPNRVRAFFYKCGGVSLGRHVTICARCFMGNENLAIGDDTFINYNVWFNTAGKIKIGEKCNIAYKVTFVTSTHEIGGDVRRAGKAISKGIEVGDGTWIGAGAMILPGVRIGKGCIIAAGSIVTKDCEDNCLYAGNPAKKMKCYKQ